MELTRSIFSACWKQPAARGQQPPLGAAAVVLVAPHKQAQALTLDWRRGGFPIERLVQHKAGAEHGMGCEASADQRVVVCAVGAVVLHALT